MFCSVIDVFHHLQHLFELYHYHQTSKVIHVRTFITNWPLKPPDRSRCLYILTLEAGVGTWCHVISVRLEVRRSTTINSRSPMPLPCSNNNNGFWQFSFATVQNDAPPRILKTEICTKCNNLILVIFNFFNQTRYVTIVISTCYHC